MTQDPGIKSTSPAPKNCFLLTTFWLLQIGCWLLWFPSDTDQSVYFKPRVCLALLLFVFSIFLSRRRKGVGLLGIGSVLLMIILSMLTPDRFGRAT
jgi:hypothetical protein